MSILDRIVATTLRDLAARKDRVSLDELERAANDASPPRNFLDAIRNSEDVALIAEVKKASPSKGTIREDFDPIQIATCYAENGATCISVLTDVPFFQGSLEYLAAVRRHVDLPLLRKDFVVDPYQVVEARAAGADAVLLIAECLPGAKLNELLDCVQCFGLTALVELYEPANLDRVVASGAPLIGINNRNLATFEVDLEHTIRLAHEIPDDRCVVAESGIATAQDVRRLREAGVDAMLVGESLMRKQDVGQAVRELLRRDA